MINVILWILGVIGGLIVLMFILGLAPINIDIRTKKERKRDMTCVLEVNDGNFPFCVAYAAAKSGCSISLAHEDIKNGNTYYIRGTIDQIKMFKDIWLSQGD